MKNLQLYVYKNNALVANKSISIEGDWKKIDKNNFFVCSEQQVDELVNAFCRSHLGEGAAVELRVGRQGFMSYGADLFKKQMGYPLCYHKDGHYVRARRYGFKSAEDMIVHNLDRYFADNLVRITPSSFFTPIAQTYFSVMRYTDRISEGGCTANYVNAFVKKNGNSNLFQKGKSHYYLFSMENGENISGYQDKEGLLILPCDYAFGSGKHAVLVTIDNTRQDGDIKIYNSLSHYMDPINYDELKNNLSKYFPGREINTVDFGVQLPYQTDCTRYVAIWISALLNHVRSELLENIDYRTVLNKYFDPHLDKDNFYDPEQEIMKCHEVDEETDILLSRESLLTSEQNAIDTTNNSNVNHRCLFANQSLNSNTDFQSNQEP
ncbi:MULTISPECIES: hypothetical protein [Cysteiniphilum]|uniref:Uncharacterized protein n=1 Tax=Cysteiniphilum litorale TaxID=2056700 RepID=A0A8J3E8Q7_9GAMM|nr:MULTISPECIES: hypothetical protein [Cysteiniphilum]GGF93417.1 hypothetical protein GCM10010995_08210 [Cysteiniphilum litorale]